MAHREEALAFNYDYIMGWEKGNEEGLKGAFDPVIRDKELDADGVAADVLFADADAVTGMASPPFGAGLFAGAIEDPELAFAGAHAHNRFLAEMCSHSPHRRGGIALVPITHDIDRAVAEIEWVAAQPGIRGIMIPTMWRNRTPYNDAVLRPGVGGLRRGRTARSTPTRARPRWRSTATTPASTWPRWCGGRCGRPGTCCSAGPSSATPTSSSWSPRPPPTGPPT